MKRLQLMLSLICFYLISQSSFAMFVTGGVVQARSEDSGTPGFIQYSLDFSQIEPNPVFLRYGGELLPDGSIATHSVKLESLPNMIFRATNFSGDIGRGTILGKIEFEYDFDFTTSTYFEIDTLQEDGSVDFGNSMANHQLNPDGTGFVSWGELIGSGDFADTTTSPIPVPATIWLFGTGLIGLLGIRKKKI